MFLEANMLYFFVTKKNQDISILYQYNLSKTGKHLNSFLSHCNVRKSAVERIKEVMNTDQEKKNW